MNETQVNAIAQAILEPHVRAQEDFQRKRTAEALRLTRQRKVAVFALIGCAIGALAAYFMGTRFTWGVLAGGFVGSILGTVVVAWLSTKSVAT